MAETLEELRAAPSSLDSSSVADLPSEAPDAPEYQCPWCGFAGASDRSLRTHIGRKHPEQKGRIPPARKAPVAPPKIAVEPPPPPRDLKALAEETARNIMTVGQLLEGPMTAAHVHALTHPDSRLPIKDIHLALAIQMRSDLAAAVWIKHAESNETLMRVILGFNRLFVGGEEVMLFGALALSALSTFGRPAPAGFRNALIPDIEAVAAQKHFQIEEQMRAAQLEFAARAERNGHA